MPGLLSAETGVLPLERLPATRAGASKILRAAITSGHSLSGRLRLAHIRQGAGLYGVLRHALATQCLGLLLAALRGIPLAYALGFEAFGHVLECPRLGPGVLARGGIGARLSFLVSRPGPSLGQL